MSNTTKFPNINEIEERVSEWLAAIDRGLTEQEQEALQQWLAESPVHGETLVHFASIWDLMDLVAPVAKLLPLDQRMSQFNDVIADDDSSAGLGGFWPGFGWLASGAVFTGLAFALAVLFIFPTAKEETAFTSVYSTEIGESSGVMLPDGSRLELNTDTEVSVFISKTQRNVELIRGEAYFDVAKNPQAPFAVMAGKTRVVAVGTAFNVERHNWGEIEVLVTEGKVFVDQFGDSSAAVIKQSISQEQPNSLSDEDVLLTVGEKATLNGKRNNRVTVEAETDIGVDLAWREGMLVFEGESLEEAISEINRYTTLKLEIADERIRNIEVGGYFRAGDTDELLVILETNFDISSRWSGDRWLLTGNTE